MWKPTKFGLFRGGARATATPADNTEQTDELDEVEEIDDDTQDDETPEETTETTPAASGDADLRAENERLKAENATLAAQAGTRTLQGAKGDALKAAVRLFGQGTPGLKQAKQLVAKATTPDEADAMRAAWTVAFGATSLAGLGAVRQTKTTTAADADADIKARAKAAAKSTRPSGSTVKED